MGSTLKGAFKEGTEAVKRGGPILAKSATKDFVNKGMNKLNKKLQQVLRNNTNKQRDKIYYKSN